MTRYSHMSPASWQRVYSCSDCGSVVTDRVRHDVFHARMESDAVGRMFETLTELFVPPVRPTVAEVDWSNG